MIIDQCHESYLQLEFPLHMQRVLGKLLMCVTCKTTESNQMHALTQMCIFLDCIDNILKFDIFRHIDCVCVYALLYDRLTHVSGE